jgi:hypothetical protein
VNRFSRRAAALTFAAALLGAYVPSSAASNLVINQNSNHKSFTTKRGSTLTLSLNSTYWTIAPKGAGSVVTSVGKEKVKAILPGPNAPTGCKIAGMGCGTVTMHFKAMKIGRTLITASRVSCGEALLCSPAQKTFSIKVVVVK